MATRAAPQPPMPVLILAFARPGAVAPVPLPPESPGAGQRGALEARKAPGSTNAGGLSRWLRLAHLTSRRHEPAPVCSEMAQAPPKCKQPSWRWLYVPETPRLCTADVSARRLRARPGLRRLRGSLDLSPSSRQKWNILIILIRFRIFYLCNGCRTT